MPKIGKTIKYMRIVFVTTEYVSKENPDGGLANYIHRITKALKKIGHTPIVIVISNKNQEFINDNVKVYKIDTSLNLFQKIIDFITYRQFSILTYYIRTNWLIRIKLKEINKEEKISIIQYTNLGGVGVFRIKSVPSVVRLSSYFPLWKEYGEYDNYNFLLKIQLNLLEKISLKRSDSIFAPSQNVVDYAGKDLHKVVELIESPFVFEKKKLDYSIYNSKLKDKKYFLFFGRLVISKGVFVISEILEDLFKTFHDIYFVFAGKEYIDVNGSSILEILNKKSGDYEDRVVYLNSMRKDLLYPLIENALAVVLPSLIDNFPNTCLESMALRKVVVGTKNTSFEQLIVDNYSGFLCEPNNPEDLLKTLKTVYRLPEEKRKTIGKNGYLRIKKLSSEKVVLQLINYYDRVIKMKELM